MNIKTITTGFLVLTLTIGGILVKENFNTEKSVYTPRSISNGGVSGQAGYAEYMMLLKADPATGKIDYNLVNQVRNEVMARSKQNNKAAIGLNWEQMGPDNVGGRTRAILVDRFVANRVYAGSIAGGLFVSNDGSNTWTPIASMVGCMSENLAVSCITQTDNGRIFFGTGASFEGSDGSGGSGFIGNGVYEYEVSTGNVLPILTNTTAVPNNSTGAQLSFVNAIASRGNRLYLATRDGMVWADPDGSNLYPSTFSGWTNPILLTPTILEEGTCLDIDIASDGSMLVCFGSKIYTSLSDAYGTFTAGSGHSGSRLSGAIAPSNPNVYYLLRSTGSLKGLEISLDKGNTWSIIVPGGSPCIDPFMQNSCDGPQGGYDDAIAVDPSDWGHVLVGGVQLYEWKYASGSNPIGGSWLKAANLFESPMNPYYVHADKHTIVWPNASTIYIGSDGGVAKSSDGAASWQEKNYGYNVTTFYDVQTAANGWFLGGAQDNGTQLFSYQSFGEPSPKGTTEISGGDGFDVAFSNQGPGIAYATSQFGYLSRFAGSSGGTFYDAELEGLIDAGNEPFHTVIENWESNYDNTSVDSINVIFSAPDSLVAGQTYQYTSLSNGSPIYYTPSVTTYVNTGDTVKVQDYIQNRFALATSAGVYVTRDAARLNAINTEWQRVGQKAEIANGATIMCMEFSADGNHLFVGTSNGVKRISGLNLANDSLGLDRRSPSNVITIGTSSGTAGVITGIAADPNNINNLIVTTGGYSTANKVYKCTNATAASMTFTQIQGSGATALPKMPVYDAEIDYSDYNKVIIGTEWGVWSTTNAFTGGTTQWADESCNGMSHVPVFAVEQQHLNSTESFNSGCIYLGTHGRGFYMTCDLSTTAIDENENNATNSGFVSNLSVFPNPLNNTGTIAFDLKENSPAKIKIYNLSGTLVKTMELGTKAKGNHKVKFDASTWSVGSYVISLESGKERKVAKFIVTR
ncbi:MAG: hypothetical protein A3K10_17730 [Bacteroidetes bacterium RIFCSPLOWO2_12_FULL_31_6]|nr:MAG: hypothetical protein A3K10_17730 [Bacteroidetes bacterium RIFCSPLOWO2_12_FULL_31_6]